MTERVPQQRNRFAQRRADADQVPAAPEKAVRRKSTAPENAPSNGDNAVSNADNAVFDESFVAAAPVRELSAVDRALHRHLLPDQRTDEAPLPLTPARWSVRPSHRFDAIRPLPVIAAAVCVTTVIAFFVILLR